jgi:hypothetical protein
MFFFEFKNRLKKNHHRKILYLSNYRSAKGLRSLPLDKHDRNFSPLFAIKFIVPHENVPLVYAISKKSHLLGRISTSKNNTQS